MKLHVIIPMAGKGSRFTDFGFKTPKFLLPIDEKGETMIHAAVDTLNTKSFHCNYTFIVQKSVLTDDLKNEMKEYNPDWVVIDGITDGPATTVMKGLENVPHDIPLLISNSDQILVNWDCEKFINLCQDTVRIPDFGYKVGPLHTPPHDGGVLTYTPPYKVNIGDKDKHSFVQIDDRGMCTKFAEKIVLSNQALIGVHYFRDKQTFIDAYNDMIKQNERAPNGEFYISLLYNSLLRQHKSVIYVPLQHNEYFYPTGEPKDYFHYLNTVTHFGPQSFTVKSNSYRTVVLNLPRLKITIGNMSENFERQDIYIDVDKKWVCNTGLIKGVHIIHVSSPILKDMIINESLSSFTRGWIIGDFTPSLVRTKEFEVGLLSHKKGEMWPFHIHDAQDEYNYLVSGHMLVNDIEYKSGDSFKFPKGHLAVPIFLEDCTVLCIKLPSIPSDKRLV